MLRMSVIYPIQRRRDPLARLIMLARKKYKSETSIGVGLMVGWGGKEDEVDCGNSDATALREFQAETKCNIESNNLEKVAVFIIHSPKRGDIDLTYYFLHNCFDIPLPQESDEMGEPVIFTEDDLPWNEMWDSDLYILPAVLQGKRLRGELWFDEHDKVINIQFWIVEKI